MPGTTVPEYVNPAIAQAPGSPGVQAQVAVSGLAEEMICALASPALNDEPFCSIIQQGLLPLSELDPMDWNPAVVQWKLSFVAAPNSIAHAMTTSLEEPGV